MINLFSNEYLLHPVGLEMSQNACGHNCFYCFATLKDSSRKFDTKKFINQINRLSISDTFLSKKIRQNYPIVFSNNTDPFAKNNENLTREILPTLINKNIPIFFQTKTGKNMYNIIDGIPPCTFYISITGTNDDLSRKIERQAPVVSERIEAINILKDKGHHVIVGINPLSEEWLNENDFNELTLKLNKLGVNSIPIGLLYFRKKEIAKIEKFEKGGVDPLDYIKGNNNLGFLYLKKMVSMYKDRGLIAPNMPFYCSGINNFLPKNFKKILTIFDFVNHIIDENKNNIKDIYFEEYFNFFNKCTFLEDGYKLDNYIFSMSTKLWIGNKENQNIMSREHFYRIIWNAKKIAQSLDMSRLFYEVGKDKNNNSIYRYMGGSIVNREGNSHKII